MSYSYSYPDLFNFDLPHFLIAFFVLLFVLVFIYSSTCSLSSSSSLSFPLVFLPVPIPISASSPILFHYIGLHRLREFAVTVSFTILKKLNSFSSKRNCQTRDRSSTSAIDSILLMKWLCTYTLIVCSNTLRCTFKRWDNFFLLIIWIFLSFTYLLFLLSFFQLFQLIISCLTLHLSISPSLALACHTAIHDLISHPILSYTTLSHHTPLHCTARHLLSPHPPIPLYLYVNVLVTTLHNIFHLLTPT